MSLAVGPTSSANLMNAPLEGMRRGIGQASAAATRIAEGEVTPDNMVELHEARIVVKANAEVARAADEMLGYFLDRKA